MSPATRIILTFIVGAICFLGLPLAGWGLDDLPGFFAEPARLAYCGIVAALNMYASIVSPEVGKTRAPRARLVERQRATLPMLQLLTLAIVIVAPYCDRRGIAVIDAPGWLRFAGLATYAAGFLLMFWAQLTLGKLFSVQVSIQEGHTLVTKGLYSRIRHPRYLGIIVFAAGIALVFRSLVALSLAAATALVLLWRIHDEESLLRGEFGDEWRAYARRSWRLVPFVYLLIAATLVGCGARLDRALLLAPDSAAFLQRAPDVCRVRLATTEGTILLEMRREWAPHGVDRFYNLVRAGYYDDAAIFRIREGTWAQFGINGDPKVAQAWRSRTIPDDPRVLSNTRGTVAYAFKDPGGRTTQVFINLRDNSATHDAEPFVPFARVVEGMDAADRLNAEYGERAGGGIRAGKQDPIFEEGNALLRREFPKLDYILRADVVK